jgi:hypothetical protein
MGFFSSSRSTHNLTTRHGQTVNERLPHGQTGRMGSFGGKGKLVTGSKLTGGKQKRNP